MENKLEVIYTKDMLDYEINVYGTEEEPLFLAKDVADWLGAKDYISSLRVVDESEKAKFAFLGSDGKVRDTWFLTEDGFYEICMRSQTEKSKKVRKFIKGILKELRTKGYVGNPDTESLKMMNKLMDRINSMQDSVAEDKNKINSIESSFLLIRIDSYELRTITLSVKERRDRHRKYFESIAKHYDVSYGRITAVFDAMIYSYMYKAIGRERITPLENKAYHMGQSLKDITKKEFPQAISAIEVFRLDKEDFENRCYKNYHMYITRRK